MKKNKLDDCGILFEDDYLNRELGGIITRPDIALTELVANAWDAGASIVQITIPDEEGEVLAIEDDGTGMSEDDISERWMKLRYNRLKHQGRRVTFPDNLPNNRVAYGKNGIGRHGLFCFGDEYRVTTIKDGTELRFSVATNKNSEPLSISNISRRPMTGHMTRFEINVSKNLPNADDIRMLLSARFLHDPQFIIKVNGQNLQMEEIEGIIDKSYIDISIVGGKVIHMEVTIVDTQKSTKNVRYQGVAIWQDRRLVGEPSWNIGKTILLDGRTTFAKRYTVVVSTEDLFDYVKEDWSGFKQSEEIDVFFQELANRIDDKIKYIAQLSIPETKKRVFRELNADYRNASPLVIQNVDEAIDIIAEIDPKAKHDSIVLVAKTLFNLGRNKSGQELLKHLSEFKDDDINGLNRILNKWTVKDALMVLDEIDKRLSIIEAIRKLSQDDSIDELRILHPLMTEARWIFGPQFESSEYISNRQLQNVIPKILGANIVIREDINYKKRPDIICLPNSTMSITGIEDQDSDTSLVFLSKVLIIELKKGGFKITRDEVNQVANYTEDFMASEINHNTTFSAFVVGDSIADNIQKTRKLGDDQSAVVYAVTYSQLVDTAERRLFGLRKTLSSMYDDVPGMDLYRQLGLSY